MTFQRLLLVSIALLCPAIVQAQQQATIGRLSPGRSSRREVLPSPQAE